LRCASRTGRRRQQGEAPLPMVNVLEQTTLATRRHRSTASLGNS
jgi:hypothetical protein